MSLKYRNASGQMVVLSGLTPGGEITPGATVTRTGTITIESLAAGAATFPKVSFGSGNEMPDADYYFEFEASTVAVNVIGYNKTASGFDTTVKNLDSIAASNIVIKWTAYKLYTVQHDVQNTEAISTMQAVIPASATSANKLVTTTQIQNITGDLDDRVSDIEDLVPSTASITNKLVTASDIEMDAVPTEYSTKAVESQGIYAINEDFQNQIDYLTNTGVKNYLKYPFVDTTVTRNDITFTDNGDGTISVSGTASKDAIFGLDEYNENNYSNYVLTGCPSGGSTGTYYLRRRIALNDSSRTYVRADIDSGDGIQLTALESGQIAQFQIFIKSGTTINLLYKPMLSPVEINDRSYAGYAKTNEELTRDSVTREEINRNGVKNELIYPYHGVISPRGITFTLNDDGTVTANGTASSPAGIYYVIFKCTTDYYKGDYIISGVPADAPSGCTISYRIGTQETDTYLRSVEVKPGQETRTIPFDPETEWLHVYLRVNVGTTVENVVFKPMIRKANIEDDTYESPAWNNSALTKVVAYNDMDNGQYTLYAPIVKNGPGTNFYTFIALPFNPIKKGVSITCDQYTPLSSGVYASETHVDIYPNGFVVYIAKSKDDWTNYIGTLGAVKFTIS